MAVTVYGFEAVSCYSGLSLQALCAMRSLDDSHWFTTGSLETSATGMDGHTVILEYFNIKEYALSNISSSLSRYLLATKTKRIF